MLQRCMKSYLFFIDYTRKQLKIITKNHTKSLRVLFNLINKVKFSALKKVKNYYLNKLITAIKKTLEKIKKF
jgi:nucleoid-associated protein YejK